MTKRYPLELSFLFALVCSTVLHAQIDVYGSYLFFDGGPSGPGALGDFVEIPDDATLDFDDTQSFTIQFWIKPINFTTTTNTLQGLVTKKTASGIGYGVFWNVTAGGNGRFQLLLKETGLSGGSSRSISTPTIIDPNTLEWVHITAIVKRNLAPATDSAYIYLDGELVVSDEISTIGDLSNSQNLRLMNYANNSSGLCAGGRLDEVRIWNKALTTRQIQRFYAEPIARNNSSLLNGKVISTFTGKRSFLLDWSDLAGYWDMEETLPTLTITDKSDNNNNGGFYQGTIVCAVAGCGPAFRSFGDPGYSPKETIVSIASGNWSDASIWAGGSGIPNSDRAIVFIKDGYTVTIDATYKVADLNIEDGSTVNANSLSVLQVVKYMHIDGNFDCKTAGTVLFDEVGSHWIYGEGNARFFNLALFENSQLTVDTENNTPVEIYGVLIIGDGRLRTNDDVVLKVNKSNANKPYGLISPVGVGAPDVRGSITMEKQLTANNQGWRQMCMPLKGKLADFNGLPLNDNTAPTAQQNVFFWDEAQDLGMPTNNVGWTSASPTSGQGKAYSIYLGGILFPFDPTITFVGEYNWGDTTYTLTYYNDPGNPLASGQTGYENGVGWNFIPNRYPSLLDVQQMIADNPLNYKPIHIWDANTQQYVAFTDNPGDFIVPYNNAGTNSAELTGAAIEPMQGFWVKTGNTENGVSFTVQDAWRSVDFGLNPHASLKAHSLIQLNVFSAQDSTWDGVGFALTEESSSTFNPKSDVYKFKSNSNVPSLYVEKDERFLQVGHYPVLKTRIILHFNAQPENKNGIYLLHLERPVENSKSLIIEDLVTGKRHDLSESTYTFSAAGTKESGRFIVHLIDTKKADTFIKEGSNLIAYLHQNEIFIESPFISGPIQLRVYDIAGRIVARYDGEMNQELRLPAPLVDEVLILEVQHSSGVERIKITTAN